MGWDRDAELCLYPILKSKIGVNVQASHFCIGIWGEIKLFIPADFVVSNGEESQEIDRRFGEDTAKL